jgi:hypothetical protein
MKTPVIAIEKDFLKAWAVISPKLKRDIKRRIKAGSTARQAVTESFKSLKFREWLKKEMEKGITASLGKAGHDR